MRNSKDIGTLLIILLRTPLFTSQPAFDVSWFFAHCVDLVGVVDRWTWTGGPVDRWGWWTVRDWVHTPCCLTQLGCATGSQQVVETTKQKVVSEGGKVSVSEACVIFLLFCDAGPRAEFFSWGEFFFFYR